MPLNEKEVADALAERQDASRVLDRWQGLRTHYFDWQKRQSDILRIYRNQWTMEWPDSRTENVDPAIPNMLRIAVEDRARSVSATPPQVICKPEGPGDEAREMADKIERIVSGWPSWQHIRGTTTQRWAMDGMGAGLMVCKVLPDFAETDLSKRFPLFTRLEPQFSYPDPIFTEGPFMDSFMYAYEDRRRTVEAKYGVKFSWRANDRRETAAEVVRVIEYYDDTWVLVVVTGQGDGTGKPVPREMILQEKHKLSCTPVVIGAAPRLDGTYSSEFSGGLGVLDYWNKLMTMIMDDGLRKVYPQKKAYGILNPQDDGPDAVMEMEDPNAVFEYVQNPNQPFSNLQILHGVEQATRTSFIMPPSRSGDPNESIISAAGVNANQGQYTEEVRALQRDMLGPMFEAAISLGLEAEEAWTPNVTKTVFGSGKSSYKETYKPSEDIKGYRKVDIRYGPMSGLDEINQGVMVLQQLGGRIISRADAMDLSPFVEDRQRTMKRQLQEALQDALISSVLQQAQAGSISPFHLAMISQAVESDEVTLSEAIAALVPQQLPLAPAGGAAPAAPGATAPGAAQSTSPGIPGAATGPQPEQLQAAIGGP